jgi:hypothetical protein
MVFVPVLLLRRIELTWKRTVVLTIVVAAFGLGALVGYRSGRPRSRTSQFASGASAVGKMVGCVDFHEAAAHLGEVGCISGRVVRVYTSRSGTTFLDFCPDYRACPFGSVIFASDQSRFGDLGSLRGRQVEVRGSIRAYQGRAEIIIHDPTQIQAVP